eukprot:TRINITY_DN82958_c0_g1_i1.p1 TRINITY_DN82958_c0_g1~~TRINITY_DN82958_c0_g1_i1.p1  ORF type:complete len:216 (-),score=40.76 TRINITY_DN82958_c0_g1_i1:62-709(-)
METGCCYKFKLLLRFLGALASALFAAQAVWLLINPTATDFWEGCHWLGQGLLGLIVGAMGCYAEVRGSMQTVTRRFSKFALNRIGLCIFYFWMGCYVMGGMGVIHSSDGWKTTAHVTGIMAWCVAVGDLCVSCCYEGAGDELLEQGPAEPSRASKSEKPTSYGQDSASELAVKSVPKCPFEDEEVGTADVRVEENPPQWNQWNTTAGKNKPFGCS